MNDRETREHLGELLKKSPDELLFGLGKLEVSGSVMESPMSVLDRARSLLKLHLPTLRSHLCGKKAFLELPELDLALASVHVLMHEVSYLVACSLAAYVSRRGLAALCAGEAEREP